MIYLASDHGGFQTKEMVKNYLEKLELKYIDLGPIKYEPSDDYPLYGKKLAEAVVANDAKGIAFCTTGVGMNIVLNKFDGIRAFEAQNMDQVVMSRKDDDTNVIVFGAKYFDSEFDLELLKSWINTNFSDEERHIRRISQIQNYEETN